MKLETVLDAATLDEARVIARVIARINAGPAIVVSCSDGQTKLRRYVVQAEDESIFAEVPDGVYPEGSQRPFVYFGARWLRKLGNVDEMYRSLGLYEVRKVERIDREKVWGR